MQEQAYGVALAARIAARIRDFRAHRGLSADALAEAAGLSAAEMRLIEEGSKDMTVEMIGSIADALDTYPIVLVMSPDEEPFLSLLEPYRYLRKNQFAKLMARLVSKGYQHSTGSA